MKSKLARAKNSAVEAIKGRHQPGVEEKGESSSVSLLSRLREQAVRGRQVVLGWFNSFGSSVEVGNVKRRRSVCSRPPTCSPTCLEAANLLPPAVAILWMRNKTQL